MPPRLSKTLLALVAMLAWLAAAAPAFAHAALVGTEPADGAMLATAPETLSLRFNEPVAPLVLRLVGPHGSAELAGRLDGTTLTIAAPEKLADGAYALAWRVVSADGHPVAGTTTFSVGAPGTPPPVTDLGDGERAAAIVAVRVGLFLALFLGVGGVFFRAWSGAAAARPAVVAALVAGLAATPLAVGLQGLDALGAPLPALGTAAVWQAGFDSRYALTAFLFAVALALALRSELRRANRLASRSLAAAAVVAVAGGLAASGHAASAAPAWLTRPSVALHGACAALWIGALIPLALALRGGDGAALRGFSRLIPVAVAALLVTGLTLAVVQVGTPAALWETDYGRVLVAKLCLVALLLGLAAWNRWRLTRPALAGAPGRRRLVRVIAAEIAVAAAIVAVAGLWRLTPPPRALAAAAAAAAPAEIHLHTAAAMADVTVTPGRAGPVAVSIVAMTGEFGPLDAKEIRLVLANPAAGIEPIRRAATRPGDGTPADGIWRIDGLTLPQPGRWTVRLDILVSDFETARLDGVLDIAP